jgi:hypothetical protein
LGWVSQRKREAQAQTQTDITLVLVWLIICLCCYLLTKALQKQISNGRAFSRAIQKIKEN